MATTDSNFFELQRRMFLWKPNTTLDDGITPLTWDADPNTVVNGNSPGETKLYSLLIGNMYIQSDGTLWTKITSPNTWDKSEGISNEVIEHLDGTGGSVSITDLNKTYYITTNSGESSNLVYSGNGIASAKDEYSASYSAGYAINPTFVRPWAGATHAYEPNSFSWWMFDFGAGNEQRIIKYSLGMRPPNVYPPTSNGGFPQNWYFQGSLNNTVWVDLSREIDVHWIGGASKETKIFSCINENIYRYYRIYITESNYEFAFPQIDLVEMFSDGPLETTVTIPDSIVGNEGSSLIIFNEDGGGYLKIKTVSGQDVIGVDNQKVWNKNQGIHIKSDDATDWLVINDLRQYAVQVPSELAVMTNYDNFLIYCIANATYYKYEVTGGNYTVDNLYVINTGDGGVTRWIGVAGRYVVDEKYLLNSKTIFVDSIDTSKELLIETDKISTATRRTMYMPDIDLSFTQHELAEVYNNSGDTLSTFRVVEISGDTVSIPTVRYLSNSLHKPIGITQSVIANNTSGYILIRGKLVTNLNCSGAAIGDVVYCDATGILTLEPSAFRVGIVQDNIVAGVIYFSVDPLQRELLFVEYIDGTLGTTTITDLDKIYYIYTGHGESSLFTAGSTITSDTPAKVGYPDTNAMDNNTTSHWWLEVDLRGATNARWIIELADGNESAIIKYRMYPHDSAAQAARDWSFQGSMNGVDWTDVHVTTGQIWTNYTWKEFTFTNTTIYKYYSFYITNAWSWELKLAEIQLFAITSLPSEVVIPDANLNNNGEHVKIYNGGGLGHVNIKTTSNQEIGGEVTQTIYTENEGIDILADSSSKWLIIEDYRKVMASPFPPGTEDGQLLYWDDTLRSWENTDTSGLIWDEVNQRIGMGTVTPNYKIHILPNEDTKSIRIDTVDFDDMTAFSAITINSEWAGDGISQTRIFQTYQEETLLHFRWYDWYSDVVMTDIYPGYILIDNDSGNRAIEVSCEEGIFINDSNGAGNHHIGIETTIWWNQRNQDIDFRIDGATDYLFYADASANNIGIGTSTPTYKLNIVPDNDAKALRIDMPDYTDMTAQTLIEITGEWVVESLSRWTAIKLWQEEHLFNLDFNWPDGALGARIATGRFDLFNEDGSPTIQMNWEEGIQIGESNLTINHHIPTSDRVWWNMRNVASIDFRIDGVSDYLFYADASVDKIGIGTNVPDYKLSIVADNDNKGLCITTPDVDDQTSMYGALTIVGKWIAEGMSENRMLQTFQNEYNLSVNWYNLDDDTLMTSISLGDIILNDDQGLSTLQLNWEEGIMIRSGGVLNHNIPLSDTVWWNQQNKSNIDFRIDGTNDYLLFADASENKIGIGTNAPGIYTLKVNGHFFAGDVDSWITNASGIQHIGGPSGSWAFLEVQEDNILMQTNGGSFVVNNNEEVVLEAENEIILSSSAGEVRFKDCNLTLPVDISDAANPSLNTTNKSIIGSINEIAVGSSGVTAYDVIVDAGGDAHFTTIQAAVVAHPNGTIFIKDGSYSGNLGLNASNNGLTLIGESRTGVIWGHNSAIITIGSNTVTNISISTMSFNSSGGDTISVGSGVTNNWVITNVFADGNSATSRFIRTNSGTHQFWRVTGCEFTRFTYAFASLYGSLVTDFVVSNNYFHHMFYAVDTFNNCKRLNLSFNTLSEVFCGLLCNGSGNEGHSISYNTVDGGTTGIAGFVCTTGTTYTTIMGNNIKIPNGRCIDLSFCNTVVVSGNVVYNSLKGLVVNGTSNCIFTGNMNINNSTANFEKVGSNPGLISSNNYAN